MNTRRQRELIYENVKLQTRKRFEKNNKQTKNAYQTSAHIRDYYNPLFMQQADRRFTNT